MANLIDKDALVAEIDERIKAWKEYYDDMRNIECYTLASGVYLRIDELENFKRFLNTLEVKEVDLEKEFSQWWKCERAKDYTVDILYERYSNVSMKLAKHFFKLGVKAKS